MITCGYCGKEVPQKIGKRKRLHCSESHKQLAYRKRKQGSIAESTPEPMAASVQTYTYTAMLTELVELRAKVTDQAHTIEALEQECSRLRSLLEGNKQQDFNQQIEKQVLPQAQQQVELPSDLIGWHLFANQHGVAQNETRKLIKAGLIHAVKGSWQTSQGTVKEALDERGRYDFYIQFCKRPNFTSCDHCPHVKGS